jgi:hypothetical protein
VYGCQQLDSNHGAPQRRTEERSDSYGASSGYGGQQRDSSSQNYGSQQRDTGSYGGPGGASSGYGGQQRDGRSDAYGYNNNSSNVYGYSDRMQVDAPRRDSYGGGENASTSRGGYGEPSYGSGGDNDRGRRSTTNRGGDANRERSNSFDRFQRGGGGKSDYY